MAARATAGGGGGRGSNNDWVKVVASVAAATAFVCLGSIVGYVAIMKYKRYRNNRVESLSLQHVIFDASDPSTTEL